MSAPETTVSVRWMIPFVRITGRLPNAPEILAREEISLADLADPETRIRHRASIELLEAALARTGDPLLGIKAGEQLDFGDLGVLDYATRNCASLREAIHCYGRYMLLMHGALEVTLIESGSYGRWEVRVTDGVPQPPAANDFAMVAACTYARRYTGQRNVLREVHLCHEVPTSEAEYARIFDGARVFMGSRQNALVFTREHLDAPMADAQPLLHTAFASHADALLAQLQRTETVSGRIRRLLVEQLRSGTLTRESLARQVGLSLPTLHRRLREEGTSYSELLNDVRRELAERYLADRSLAIGEIAFLLGFAHVTAFYKAFPRWFAGVTPAEYRAQLREGRDPSSRAS